MSKLLVLAYVLAILVVACDLRCQRRAPSPPASVVAVVDTLQTGPAYLVDVSGNPAMWGWIYTDPSKGYFCGIFRGYNTAEGPVTTLPASFILIGGYR